MHERFGKKFTIARIDKLINELFYELTRFYNENENEGRLSYQYVINIKNGVVLIKFDTQFINERYLYGQNIELLKETHEIKEK